MTLEALIEKVRTLSAEQQETLLREFDNALNELKAAPLKTHSLLEFEGVGAHLYDGTDAQKYINELRKEWDHRP